MRVNSINQEDDLTSALSCVYLVAFEVSRSSELRLDRDSPLVVFVLHVHLL